MIAGFLIYCFMQTPFFSGFPQRKELRTTARNTMMGVVHTLNIFSFQSLNQEAKKDLQSIQLIPKKKTASPAKAGEQGKEDRKNQSRPAENKPAERSVKKDSAASFDKPPEKPAENKKTE